MNKHTADVFESIADNVKVMKSGTQINEITMRSPPLVISLTFFKE